VQKEFRLGCCGSDSLLAFFFWAPPSLWRLRSRPARSSFPYLVSIHAYVCLLSRFSLRSARNQSQFESRSESDKKTFPVSVGGCDVGKESPRRRNRMYKVINSALSLKLKRKIWKKKCEKLSPQITRMGTILFKMVVEKVRVLSFS